ncbi:MAG: hypothetical protein QXE81_01230 [Desulfurococcaceae archaeon]
MQLLQKLRDSSFIESVVKEIEEAEIRAREYSNNILNFLTQSSGNIITYSYTGYGYTPASLMYWYSLTFQSTKFPLLLEAEESSIYLLPYRDDIAIIIYSTGEYSKLIQTIQVARVLNVDYIAFTPEPRQEQIKSALKYYGVEILSRRDDEKVETVIELTLASFFAISELLRNQIPARGSRLFTHGKEGFSLIAQSLYEKYVGVLESILKHNELFVTSTKFLEASSILLAYSLRQIGIEARYIPLNEALDIETPVLALMLSTDDRAQKEIRHLRSLPLLELVLNVDPLEAMVYIAILAFFLSRLTR